MTKHIPNNFDIFSEEDSDFLQDIFERFSRVKQGFRFFYSIPPEDRYEMAHRRLSKVLRSGYVRIGVPDEAIQTVREHTDDCAKLARFMFPDDDLLVEVMEAHDIAEPVVTDFTPFDDITKEEKRRLEYLGLEFITCGLSKWEQERVLMLLRIYEEGNDITMRRAHDVDRLEMAMQCQIYGRDYPHLRDELIPFWAYVEERVKTPEGIKFFKEISQSVNEPHSLKL